MNMNNKMIEKLLENSALNKTSVEPLILSQKNFTNDLLEILLIGMKPQFQESFFKCTEKQAFLEQIEEQLSKAKFVSNKTASSMIRENLIIEINELLPEFIQLLDQKSFEMEMYINGKTSLTSRALAKYVDFFNLELIETIKKCKTEEAQEWIEDLISNSDDILCYLGFKYFVTQIEKYKFVKSKKQWIMPIASNYINLFLIKQTLLATQLKLMKLEDIKIELSKDNAKKDKVIESKKNDIAKLNEKMSDMNLKLKQKEKHIVLKEVETLKQELEFEKVRYADLEKKYLALDKKYLAIDKKNIGTDYSTNHKSIIEQLNKEIEKSHKENEKLKSVLLDKKASEINWHKYNLFTELNLFLEKNGMTSDLRALIEPYMSLEIETPQDVARDLICQTADYFGYCEVTEKGHFVVDISGNRRSLGDIPDDLYLGQNQIVLVDRKGNLLQTFFYQYESDEFKVHVDTIALLEKGENGLEVITAEEARLPFINLTPYNLQTGRVVGLNTLGEVVKSYKPIKFNADFFLDSALIRDQQVYALEKSVGECLIVKEVPSGIMKVVPIPVGMNAAFDEFSILFLKEDQIIKSFKSHRFYTSSSFYKKLEYVTISVDDQGIFFERSNGERRILGQLSLFTLLESGDVVAVDEYMNFVEKQVQKEVDLKSLEKVNIAKKLKNQEIKYCDEMINEESEALCELRSEKILIIGNDGMQQSYKLTLFKYGYVAEVVSGVESWHKIAKAVRQNDVIVFVTDFAKHQHYYKFKEEFADKNVIYAPCEGANRIVSLLNEKFGIVA